MSDATWKVQASVKTPSGTLVNIRGDNGAELLAGVEYVIANAEKIVSLEAALGGVANVAAGLGGTVVEHQASPPVTPAAAPWQAPASSPAPQASAAPATGAPIDQFGKPMVYKTGVSKATGNAWKAWMGDYPKDDPQGKQVPPQWIR